MNAMENNKFLTKYYNKLKFDVELDVVLINDDEELVEMLVDRIYYYKSLAQENFMLKEQVSQLQSELQYLDGMVDALKR